MTIPPPARAADRLIAIVESFLKAPQQTLSEIANSSGLDPASVLRYLQQLAEHGWIVRDDTTRVYRLGLRLFSIGQLARNQDDMRSRALPGMRALLERFDETINMGVHRGEDVVIIEALESNHSIRRGASVGEIDNWFASSLGKSILAYLPAAEVDRIFESAPPARLTDRSITEIAGVHEELATVRVLGYAFDDEEAEPGLKCVGVPVVDHDGVARHAISISGPVARIDAQLDDIIAALLQFSAALGARDPRGLQEGIA